MRTFKDASDREWSLDFNIATARALRAKTREALDVDFMDYAALLASLNDPFFAADLLFLVCSEQAKERGIDAEEFGRGLKGRALFDAVAELTAEYLDFFPDPTTAEKMKAFVERNRDFQSRLCDAICSKTEQAIETALADAETKLGETFSNASPSPEETTAPSPR